MKDTKKAYMLVGGGSGGHLTPLIAIAQELKSRDVHNKVIYVGQKNEGLSEVTDHTTIDETFAITAGKFRRYHATAAWKQLLDIRTLLLNTRDFFRFLRGIIEAYVLLKKERPDVIFLKGGFVCVPVGLAARLLHIPYITHDSDAVPGLANKLTAKHAVINATALEPSLYPYDQRKTRQVGIPLQREYIFVDEKMQRDAKRHLSIPEDSPVIVSVGGGLGARRVNQAVVSAAKDILTTNHSLHLIHVTGKKLFDETLNLYNDVINDQLKKRVHVVDFSTELYSLTAAADIIITRAGATNIAESAMQAKPCIVIPNPILTGGQQLHNAKVLEKASAAIIIDESRLESLAEAITKLLEDDEMRKKLSRSLHTLAKPNANALIADLLIETAINSQKD